MKLAVTILVFCVAALLALGMVMLYSSGMGAVGARYLVLQSIWCGLGLVACGCAMAIDYRILKKFVWPFFGLSLVLLVAVMVPHVGLKVNGARRWLGLGSVRFQCSELAKYRWVGVGCNRYIL